MVCGMWRAFPPVIRERKINYNHKHNVLNNVNNFYPFLHHLEHLRFSIILRDILELRILELKLNGRWLLLTNGKISIIQLKSSQPSI